MMRLMLSIAELVCSVANARCPVSAIVSAAAMVSRSRISPTSTTSGSCRSAYLRAAEKLLVSVPISRWFTMQLWCRWMNSIGSYRDDVALELLVDLVDHGRERRALARPRRPRHQHQPARLFGELCHHPRQPQVLEGPHVERNLPDDERHAPPLLEAVAAEPRQVLDSEGKVELVLRLEPLLLGLGEHGVGDRQGVLGREHHVHG